MTPDELETVLRQVNARWPHHPVPDSSGPAWFEDLGGHPVADVLATIIAISREGRDFPPTCGQVRQRLDELTIGAPDFDEAWRELLEFMRRHGSHAAASKLPWSNPLYGELALALGWRDLGLTPEEDLPTLRAQARRMWDAMVRRQRQRMLFADIPSDLAGLRHASGTASIGDTLRSPLLGVDDGTALTPAPDGG